jgi:hypothetical protein
VAPGSFQDDYVTGPTRGVGDGFAFYTVNLIDERIISVEVPYLQPFHFSRTFNSEVNSSVYNQTSNGILEMRIEDQRMFAQNPMALTQAPVEPQNVVTCDIYIAAGDDFAFHFPVPSMQGAGAVGTVNYTQFTAPTSVLSPGEDEVEKSYIKV